MRFSAPPTTGDHDLDDLAQRIHTAPLYETGVRLGIDLFRKLSQLSENDPATFERFDVKALREWVATDVFGIPQTDEEPSNE